MPTDPSDDKEGWIEFGSEPELDPTNEKSTRSPRLDPISHKDRVRAWLALGLLGTLGITILLTFCLIARHDDLGLQVTEITDSTGQIYTALITLVGTATGFYFGGREKS